MEFVSNNKTEDYDLNQKSQRVILFKFELSQSQSIIILMFALTGLFLLPYFLAGEIFYSLFYSLFIDYYFYQLVPAIANIIMYSFFFILSFITVRRIILGLGGEGGQKSNIIPHDRIVKWFGLKLSHSQAIFIFSLSIMGIPFLILRILGMDIDAFEEFYKHLLFIPGGYHSFYYNEVLLEYAPFYLDGLFFIMCLYSIIATRRRKKAPSNQLKTASNLGVFIFIISLIVLVLYLIRLVAHLFIIFTDLAYLVGYPVQSNSIYQVNDFFNVVIILIGSSSFLAISYFLKKGEKNIKKEQQNLTWFHVKLTKNRYIILLSYVIIYSCVLSFGFASQFFTRGLYVFQVDIIISYLIFSLPILYSLFKIRNKDAFHRILTQYNDSEDFKANWFKFRVNRLQSVILGSISSGAMFFYMFFMITFRTFSQLTEPGEFYMLYFVQDFSLISLISIMLLFSLYTIKCTYKAV